MLRQRTDAPEGYYNATVGDKHYSVVNFGVTMKNHPMPYGVYMGWEAIEIKKSKLDVDELFRAESWEKLKTKLS